MGGGWSSWLGQPSSVSKTPPTSVWSAMNQTVVLMQTPSYSTIEGSLPVNAGCLANSLVIGALYCIHSWVLFFNAEQSSIGLGKQRRTTCLSPGGMMNTVPPSEIISNTIYSKRNRISGFLKSFNHVAFQSVLTHYNVYKQIYEIQ